MPYLGLFPDRNTAVSALSGCTAGFVAVMVAHPVETIKVRMQAQKTGYRWRDILTLVKNPYYGIAPHLPHYGAMNILRFGAYEFAKPLFGVRDGQTMCHWQRFACGSFSGLMVAGTLHPFFVVRTIQQANRIGFQETVSTLWNLEGVRGFFRTYDVNLIRLGVAFGVFFSSYAVVKERLSDRDGRLGALGRSLAGGITGVMTWSSIYPIDVLQSRLVTQPIGHRTYHRARDCAMDMYREGGLRIFTRGYSAVLIRAFPVNAILLPVSDFLRQWFFHNLPAGQAVWAS